MRKRSSPKDEYGPLAIVTGAASGIGAAFAARLARDGLALLLVDLDGPRLESIAAGLRSAHRVDVRTMRLDLTSQEDVARLTALAETDDVGLVVHSAGMHVMGAFVDQPLAPQHRAIDLHCHASAALAHAFGRSMRARRRGGLVLLSSNSAILASPLIANYAATKAYTLTLACALWEELRHDGVDVLALVPGMTDTPGLQVDRPNALAKSLTQTPETVVDLALDALGRGPVLITSASDRFAAGVFGRLLPRAWSLPLARRSLTTFFPHLRGR